MAGRSTEEGKNEKQKQDGPIFTNMIWRKILQKDNDFCHLFGVTNFLFIILSIERAFLCPKFVLEIKIRFYYKSSEHGCQLE